MISADKLRAYFEDHLREDPDFEMPEELKCPDQQEYFELDEAVDVDQGVPSVEEVEGALAKLKNQKSSGVDKCALEGLKYGRGSAWVMHDADISCLVHLGGSIKMAQRPDHMPTQKSVIFNS